MMKQLLFYGDVIVDSITDPTISGSEQYGIKGEPF